MAEKPILFSAPMVPALLAGTKTQTRRPVTWRNVAEGLNLQFTGLRAERLPDGLWVLESDTRTSSSWRCARTPCPYGQPGDRLWVRESWSGTHAYQDERPSERVSVMTPDGPLMRNEIWYWADGEPVYGDWERPRPSIHMPR
ncbi:hypothetical protein [Acidovorax sp. NCPPB 4044]|uniref:hypothetical protein n=1 Tax=Acidovorax sp. NCPPB 4044 TaxID=2940490 RepID=UPI0023049477|nr:hypothetical protein [Acidovorax sp. NCPPB 4044]MDA8522020.1 hypothetical protein [Acidovorax sp. NCPPB 4044]